MRAIVGKAMSIAMMVFLCPSMTAAQAAEKRTFAFQKLERQTLLSGRQGGACW